MKKIILGFCLILAASSSAFADNDYSNLGPVHQRLYGNSPWDPSPGTQLYNYLRETHARTTIRSFPKTPADGNAPVENGDKKLVVAVSPQTFPAFLKYFSSINYLFINSMFDGDHIQPAYRGKAGVYSPPFIDQLGFTNEGVMMIPVLLDDQEAGRAENFFNTSSQLGLGGWSEREGMFYPENIEAKNNSPFFPKGAYWSSCASWFPNLPIGNQLTYTYYFPSGDDVTPPVAQNLVDYELPDANTNRLMHGVWQVPGHRQLGDMLNRPAMGRGEFHNGGWIIYTLLGSVSWYRTPVVFLQVNDATKPIDSNFDLHVRAE